MPEPAAPPAVGLTDQPVGNQPAIESAPASSRDPFPGLSKELDEIIGKSNLGTPENEQRAGKVRKEAPAKQAKPADKPADKPAGKPADQKSADKPADKPADQKADQKADDKPADQKADDQKSDQKPADKPADQKAEGEADKPTEKLGPWQRAHQAERRVKELEAKLQEVSSRKPGDDPEKLELRKQLTETESKLKALNDEFRYIDYERSEEFTTKYKKPYEDMARRAVASLADYKVTLPDGTQRAATANDFWSIVTAPSQPDARQKAKALFGDDAQDILDWRTKLRDSFHSMENAKAEFRQSGEERQKQWERQQAEQQEALRKQSEANVALWNKLNEAAIEQHKDWFVAEEGDEEGAEVLRKGFELADLAWNGSDKLDPEKLIALRSAERNKAAGFRYQVLLNERLKAKLEEAEKALAEYQKSEPGAGEQPGEKKVDADDLDAAIARIPRV